MKKYNIMKISSRQKFDMSPEKLDQHILKMMGQKVGEFDVTVEEFRNMINTFVAGIQDKELREYIMDAVTSLDTHSLSRAIWRNIKEFED